MDKKQTEIKRWLAQIDELLDEIQRWCHEVGWEFVREDKTLDESKLGRYEVSILKIRTPSGVVYVEPVARYVVSGDGLVDLYAWPSLRRMLLVQNGNRWELKTDSGVPWPNPWSRETFVDIVPALNAAA